jgi:hypothetical protein
MDDPTTALPLRNACQQRKRAVSAAFNPLENTFFYPAAGNVASARNAC